MINCVLVSNRLSYIKKTILNIQKYGEFVGNPLFNAKYLLSDTEVFKIPIFNNN